MASVTRNPIEVHSMKPVMMHSVPSGGGSSSGFEAISVNRPFVDLKKILPLAKPMICPEIFCR